MQWVQVYDPLGSAVLSPATAGLPILVLSGLLVSLLQWMVTVHGLGKHRHAERSEESRVRSRRRRDSSLRSE